MPRLLFTGFAHTRYYRSGSQEPWAPGEVREVDEEEAAYLVRTFGRDVFAPQEEPKITRKRSTRKG